MRYLMFVCVEEGVTLGPDEMARIGPDTDRWVAEMDGRGVRVEGNRLRPVSDATSIRVREGELLVTDGPFAETKEQIAGYDLLECSTLEEAIEVASKHPVARFGMLELRPLWQD